MMRNQAVIQIKRQMAFRRTLDSEIIEELQTAQTMLEIGPTKPWFLISERSTELTVANEERVAVPSDFLAELDEEGLSYIPADTDEPEVQLVKRDIDFLKYAYQDVEPGPPEAYALVGEYFRLRPIPDDIYTIRMIYYKKDTTLDTNVENGWLKHVPYLIMGTALDAIASAVGDAKAMKKASDWISIGAAILYKHNEARKHENMDYQIGGRHW